MLETVREYGEARLDAAGDRDAAMAGLVGWAREQAVALAARLHRPRPGRRARTVAPPSRTTWSRACGGRWAADDEPAAVDIATALFHLWAVRGLHLEVLAWARGLLHVDDPQRRLRSAILRGRPAAGRCPTPTGSPGCAC